MDSTQLLDGFEKLTEKLSFEETGRLILAVVAYVERGEEKDLPGRESVVFPTIKERVDAMREKERAVSEKRRASGRMGGLAKAKNAGKQSLALQPVAEKSAGFRPPTLEEVMDYVDANRLGFNAQKFYDHYQGNGWMVGNNKMANWQAIARRWGDRERDRAREEYNRKSPAQRLIARIEAGEFDE